MASRRDLTAMRWMRALDRAIEKLERNTKMDDTKHVRGLYQLRTYIFNAPLADLPLYQDDDPNRVVDL